MLIYHNELIRLRLPLWLSWQRIHLQCGRPGFDPWVGKIPWRRERLPTPVFWPGEFHGLYKSMGSQRVRHDWVTELNWSLIIRCFNKTFFKVLIFFFLWNEVKFSQSCLTLCNPMDYTVHGILHLRTLEWVTFPFSRESSQTRDWTQVSHIAGGFFTS